MSVAYGEKRARAADFDASLDKFDLSIAVENHVRALVMDQIAQASTAQNRGIQEVHEAIGQIDHVTQQNAGLVEEAAAPTAAMHRPRVTPPWVGPPAQATARPWPGALGPRPAPVAVPAFR